MNMCLFSPIAKIVKNKILNPNLAAVHKYMTNPIDSLWFQVLKIKHLLNQILPLLDFNTNLSSV